MNPKPQLTELTEFPVQDLETKKDHFSFFLSSIHKGESYTGNSINTGNSPARPSMEGATPTPEELSDWYCNRTTKAERIPIRKRRQALVRAGIPFADADNQAILEAWTAAKMKGGRE